VSRQTQVAHGVFWALVRTTPWAASPWSSEGCDEFVAVEALDVVAVVVVVPPGSDSGALGVDRDVDAAVAGRLAAVVAGGGGAAVVGAAVVFSAVVGAALVVWVLVASPGRYADDATKRVTAVPRGS
jgi:hypothetical protein